MNKKQITVTALLLSLMLLLAISQSFFTDNFSNLNIIEKNIVENIYTFENYSIEFPSEWNVDESENKNDYISYNVEFKNVDKSVSGLLQVINTKQDIRVYAENDMKKQPLKYSDNEIIPFENSESIGVLSKYNTEIDNGYSYINRSYYIKGDNGQIIKILFNISKNSHNSDLDNECSNVISSIKHDK